MTNQDGFGSYDLITGNEGSGACWWCAGDFPDRRARRFCSEACGEEYRRHYYWAWAMAWALQRAGHQCANCHRMDYWGNERISWGDPWRQCKWAAQRAATISLEIHHIVPLNGDRRTCDARHNPDNLMVLCHDCHVLIHRAMREEKKPVDPWEIARRGGQQVMALGGTA